MNTTHQKYSPSEITWADQLADTGPSQGGKWVFFPGAAALEAPKLPQGIFSRLLNIFNFFLGGGLGKGLGRRHLGAPFTPGANQGHDGPVQTRSFD